MFLPPGSFSHLDLHRFLCQPNFPECTCTCIVRVKVQHQHSTVAVAVKISDVTEIRELYFSTRNKTTTKLNVHINYILYNLQIFIYFLSDLRSSTLYECT